MRPTYSPLPPGDMGFMALVICACLYAIVMFTAGFAGGWKGRQWYDDREFARVTARLCEEGVFCGELAK